MASTSANILDDQIFEGYGETHDERITALLRNVSDEDLALFLMRSKEEQDRRLTEAEEKLAAMKKAFGLSEPPRITSKLTTGSATPISQRKQSKRAKGIRAPRGKAKELILAFLKDGPKKRKQIEAHFENKKMSTNSVGTLLNRLKDEGIVTHDATNKLYSTKQDKSNIHEPTAIPS